MSTITVTDHESQHSNVLDSAMRRVGDRLEVLAAERGWRLGRVRRDGPPANLPTTADLDPSSSGLGATYEEAWTVCRLIGRTYGQQKMVDLYEAVDAGTPVGRAFRTVLGTTQADFVKSWRADLTSLAAGRAG